MNRHRALLLAVSLLPAACGAPRGDALSPAADATPDVAVDASTPDAPTSDAPTAAADAPTAAPDARADAAQVDAPMCSGDCGPHGHAHGSECHCDEGYVDREMCCVPAPPCTAPDDLLEENDGPTDATPVRDGSATFEGLRMCPADADVFRVPLTMGQRVEVRATFAHADGDIDVYLFAPGTDDLGHARPLAGSDGTRDNERLTYTARATGEHLLRVTGFNGSENTYGLSIEVSDP